MQGSTMAVKGAPAESFAPGSGSRSGTRRRPPTSASSAPKSTACPWRRFQSGPAGQTAALSRLALLDVRRRPPRDRLGCRAVVQNVRHAADGPPLATPTRRPLSEYSPLTRMWYCWCHSTPSSRRGGERARFLQQPAAGAPHASCGNRHHDHHEEIAQPRQVLISQLTAAPSRSSSIPTPCPRFTPPGTLDGDRAERR